MELKEKRIMRIKNKMTEHGLNSRELAKRSGISESGISRILTGEIEPRLKTFIKIADALRCDYVWLMGYDVEPEKEVVSVVPEYFNLSVENRTIIDHLIKELAASQKQDDNN